ncbi:antitoxin VbhA family protein [Methylobacterium flocculans]|uniref:antitoxin VbhA family protein n=1 Tax=Methylobacterium flocculans TaxID=2984843 RepID=UPI0021F30D41|nr:hypothetical protein [Methylobacterium sp. FF17]
MTTPDEQSRARDVRAALASARIEGVKITPDAMAIFDAYVAGTIDDVEMARHVLSLCGPTPQPDTLVSGEVVLRSS